MTKKEDKTIAVITKFFEDLYKLGYIIKPVPNTDKKSYEAISSFFDQYGKGLYLIHSMEGQ